MAYFNRSFGPTSAKKKRAGKSRGHNNKQYNIYDIDKNSCQFGIVENIINKNTVNVKSLLSGKSVHCTTHKSNSRMFDKGCPVVFSYLRSDTTGEIVAKFSTDELHDLCDHFNIGYEKVCNLIGSDVNNVTIDVDSLNNLNNLKISSMNDKPVETKDKIIYVSTIPDEYFDQLSDSEEEKVYRVDKFGNTIESEDEMENSDEVIIDVNTDQAVENIEQPSKPEKAIDVVTTNVNDDLVEDGSKENDTTKSKESKKLNKTGTGERAKKKDYNNTRANARSNKLSFANAEY